MMRQGGKTHVWCAWRRIPMLLKWLKKLEILFYPDLRAYLGGSYLCLMWEQLDIRHKDFQPKAAIRGTVPKNKEGRPEFRIAKSKHSHHQLAKPEKNIT